MIKIINLFHETAILAAPRSHQLAHLDCLKISDLKDAPMIVPDRGSRPHSHNLTMKLFEKANIPVKIIQFANEKQTIINLVAANIGLAIVPRWISKLTIEGVKFIEITGEEYENQGKILLAAAFLRNIRDIYRNHLLQILQANINFYLRQA